MRLKEAAKLGFKRAIAPAGTDGGPLKVIGVSRLADAIRRIGESDWD
jgi:DNA repair protein RadA/Sms